MNYGVAVERAEMFGFHLGLSSMRLILNFYGAWSFKTSQRCCRIDEVPAFRVFCALLGTTEESFPEVKDMGGGIPCAAQESGGRKVREGIQCRHE